MRTSRRLGSLACILAALAVFWLYRGLRDETGVPDTTSKVEVVTSDPGPRPSTAAGDGGGDLVAAPAAGTSADPNGGGSGSASLTNAVTGVVLDEASRLPIADAAVLLRPMDPAALRGAPIGDGPPLAHTKTDAQGRFRFDLEELRDAARDIPRDVQWLRAVASAPDYATVGVRFAAPGAQLEIALPMAGELEVRVFDMDGESAEAAVEVRIGDTVTRTGSQHVVRVRSLPPGAAHLRVHGRTLGTVRAGPVAIHAGELTSIEVMIPATVDLLARLVDRATGELVTSAAVRVARPGASTEGRRGGSGGAFRIRAAGGVGERVFVAVDAEGYAPVLVPVVLRPPDDKGQSIEIELERAPPWTGEVIGPDGSAVAGAIVRYTANGVVGRNPSQTETDEHGRFSLPPPPPPAPGRRIVLVAEKDGGTAALALRPGQRQPQPLLLHLQGGARVSARIVDPDGKPVIGAQVRLWPDWQRAGSVTSPGRGRLQLANERGFSDLSAATGADGRFMVTGVPHGRFHAEVRWKGNVHWPGDAFGVSGDDVALGTIMLGQGAGLSGRVSDQNGRRLEGVRVRMRPRLSEGPRRPRETTTDTNGEYAFVDLRPGAFVLTAAHADHELTREEIVIDVSGLVRDLRLDGHAQLTIRLEGRRPRKPLVRVQLRTSDGRPVGAPRTARLTGDVPAVSIPAPPGRFQIEVTAGTLVGYSTAPIDVSAGFGAETTISLRRGGGVAGRIVDRRSEPIRGAAMSFVHAHRGTRHDVTAGLDGRFRLVPMDPGIWKVSISGRGGVPARFEVVVESERERNQEFVLEEGGSVRVKVIADDGAVQSGAVLMFRDAERAYPASPPDRTDASGLAVRRHLPAGSIRVDARLGGWTGFAEVVVVENDTVEVTVTILGR